MNRKSFLTAAAASLFVLPFAIANPNTSDAAGADLGVTVNNTAANPVPTSAVGTTQIAGTVNLGNQPTVDARQSGTWTVGIDGTPTVNIAGTPTVAISGTPSVSLAGTSAVTIANTAASPALVRDVGEDRQLYTGDFYGVLPDGEFNGCLGQLTVPAGRRLIVQHITGELFRRADAEILTSFNITNGATDQYVLHAVRFERNTPSSSYYHLNGPLLAYGAPGSTACLAVRRVGSLAVGAIDGNFTISGYTVPAP